jgi:response regulator RpfG family c-di-GMP phosphodiesterase
VARFARRIGAEMGVRGVELATIERGALIHELGDRAAPAVTGRNGADLSDLVREPLLGAELLERLPFLVGVAAVIRAQRERYDGGGYPSGLRGDQICLGARVLAVAHAWDELGAAEIERGAGQKFDPQVVAAWLRVPAREWQRIRIALPGALGERPTAPAAPEASPARPPSAAAAENLPKPATRGGRGAAIARIRLRQG